MVEVINKCMCTKYLIYKFTSITSTKSYVGVTCLTPDQRLSRHLTEAKRGSKYHFHRALLKYGKDDFSLHILERDLDKITAYSKESWYIDKFNTQLGGYNMTPGGDCGPVRAGALNGMFGKFHTNQSKILMSEAKKQLIGAKHPHYGKESPLKGKSYEEIVGKDRAIQLKNEKKKLHLGRKRPYNMGDNNPAKRLSVRRKISESRSTPIVITGVRYKNKKDACIQLGISLYKLNKLTNREKYEENLDNR